jgi:hypothetical protein
MPSLKGFIGLKLLESDNTIKKAIHEGIAEHINGAIKKNKQRTTRTLKTSIKKWVGAQPEIASLLSRGGFGSLNAQFGLPSNNAETAVGMITSLVSESLQIRITPVNAKLKGRIEFNFQPTDFSRLLGLNSGHITTKKGQDLHWLDWLLTKGDMTIVTGYSYIPGNVGRSGGGSMGFGGVWRVPPEFSGTLQNNFITRSFIGREKEITSILQGLLK